MAVDVAATQSAKGVQLHTANSLARLWRDQGKLQQALAKKYDIYFGYDEKAPPTRPQYVSRIPRMMH
jgi:hypothetical protein